MLHNVRSRLDRPLLCTAKAIETATNEIQLTTHSLDIEYINTKRDLGVHQGSRNPVFSVRQSAVDGTACGGGLR